MAGVAGGRCGRCGCGVAGVAGRTRPRRLRHGLRAARAGRRELPPSAAAAERSCRRAQLSPSAVPGLDHGSRLRSDLHRCTVDGVYAFEVASTVCKQWVTKSRVCRGPVGVAWPVAVRARPRVPHLLAPTDTNDVLYACVYCFAHTLTAHRTGYRACTDVRCPMMPVACWCWHLTSTWTC